MKTISLFYIAILVSFSMYAYNPKTEAKENKKSVQTEMNGILDKVLDVDENQFIDQPTVTNKIVIIDKDFNKIREESVANEENLNSQSMLVPIIYRSEFIIKVHNVSYYMLEKNNFFQLSGTI